MSEPKVFSIRVDSKLWLDPLLMDYECKDISQAVRALASELKKDGSCSRNDLDLTIRITQD